MKYVFFYDFPVGSLGIAEDDGAICRVFFAAENAPDGFEVAETPLIRSAAAQLAEYFDGKRRVFDLPLRPQGTQFQQSVWRALQAIPAGETRSYQEIAAAVGNPKASRAVGMANNRNPIVIIVPCHRVIGKNGALVGYGGGLRVKEHLLEMEKSPATAAATGLV
ncbi:MAG: methylated-DNA--[protein]-cysteine S-methyltransferase [Oscillospiraceae bacterium]|jgi:methylated-DNA-[protein]-cysteine S-methyltransferase|nr:methylated-DNA--[protein]-cysteine S-methyltransferase [Oscillospiraceae bacterium]